MDVFMFMFTICIGLYWRFVRNQDKNFGFFDFFDKQTRKEFIISCVYHISTRNQREEFAGIGENHYPEMKENRRIEFIFYLDSRISEIY